MEWKYQSCQHDRSLYGRDLSKTSILGSWHCHCRYYSFVALAFRRVLAGLSSWKFGMAAIVALIHDITIIIGFCVPWVSLWVEVDALFITALLTVLGFSVNDTIVIFDRIHGKSQRKTCKRSWTISEISVWQSMRRSVNTSLSTLIVIAVMLVFLLVSFSLLLLFLRFRWGLLLEPILLFCSDSAFKYLA